MNRVNVIVWGLVAGVVLLIAAYETRSEEKAKALERVQSTVQAVTGHDHDHGMSADMAHQHLWAAVTDAVCVLHPTKDNKAHGWVRFSQSGDKVVITAQIEGLTPNSEHGFHIHEYGDCSAPDATSAGPHYNPEGHKHGAPDASNRHAGDLGNIKADENGVARLDVTVDNITIAGTKAPIVGRAVIVHAKADDLKTQPTGDAGGRIACGVIGIAKSTAPEPAR